MSRSPPGRSMVAPGADVCVSSERNRPCASRADSSCRAMRSAMPMSSASERKHAHFLVPCALRGKLALHEEEPAYVEPRHLAGIYGFQCPLGIALATPLHPRHGEMGPEGARLELESRRPQSGAKPRRQLDELVRPV